MMNKKKDKLDKVIKQVFERVKKQGPKGEVCPDDEVLAAYCEGTLDEEGREKIEEHIAFCSQCAESLLAFAEAEKSYSSDVKTYSTDKMLRWVKSLVKEKERTSLWDGISNWLSPFRLRPAVVMAAVLVVVVVGLFSLQAPYPEMPLPAQFNLIARIYPQDLSRGTSGERRELEIQTGGVLHSGDLIKIRFTPQEDVYAYLLAVNSLGNVTMLFPDQPTGAPLHCKSGKPCEFPEKDNWLKLDENTGHEKILLITSKGTLEKMDEKVKKLKKEGIHKINKIFSGSRIQSFGFEHRQKVTQ